jgi:5-amino-6-(5-phosphoribosylamino)uracil reductase
VWSSAPQETSTPPWRSSTTEPGGCLVYTDADAARRTRERLGAKASIIAAGAPPDLRAVLADLATRGVARLLVEGGGTLHTQFLTQGLADELQLVTAPFFIGDPRAPRFVGPGRFLNDPEHPLRLAETRAIGDRGPVRAGVHRRQAPLRSTRAG